MKYLKDENVKKSILIYSVSICIGLCFYFCIKNFSSIQNGWSRVISIMQPFIIGGIIAYLLRVPMEFCENSLLNKWNVSTKTKHRVAVLLAFLFGFAVMFVFFYILIPSLLDSAITLATNLEQYLKNFEEIILEYTDALGIDLQEKLDELIAFVPASNELINTIMNFAQTYLPNVLDRAINFGKGVMNFIVGIIIAVYILLGADNFKINTERIMRAFLSEKEADRLIEVVHKADLIFKNFIAGKLLDSLIIGVISFIVMSIFKWPFAVLISVIIGVTNIIPFFGPFIGAVPGFLIELVVDPLTSVWFLIFVVILQQFDGNILGPKILGDSLGLPAIWIIFAILVGSGLFGLVGMIVGVPIFALIYVLFKERVAHNLDRKTKQSGIVR